MGYVKINGKQVYSVENKYPRDFSNMMVYASDPRTEAPNAELRNLKLTTSYAPTISTYSPPSAPTGLRAKSARLRWTASTPPAPRSPKNEFAAKQKQTFPEQLFSSFVTTRILI